MNLGALRPWVAAQLRERLGFEDDIVEGFVLGQLEGASADPRAVTVSLKPFLGDEHATPFVAELWRLLHRLLPANGCRRPMLSQKATRDCDVCDADRQATAASSARRSDRSIPALAPGQHGGRRTTSQNNKPTTTDNKAQGSFC